MSRSSLSKIQNKLQDELMNKIGLLLDKPISVKSTKQIIDTIQHVGAPKQKILTLLMNKYRSDLILHLIKNHSYILSNQSLIKDTLNNIQKNIMNYNNFHTIISIWKEIIKLIFSRSNSNNKTLNQTQQLIYTIGYENLLKQGIKLANLQKKDKIFQLIYSNIGLFWQLGLKDNLRKVITTYIEIFIKYPVAVVYYVKVVGLIVRLVKQSRSLNQQNQYNNQVNKNIIVIEKLPEISTQNVTQIVIQLNNILHLTREKPLYLLQNQCITTLVSIFNQTKKLSSILNNDILYQLNKMLQIFLYRKGTRDQSRKLLFILNKGKQQLMEMNHQKMLKQYSQSSQNIEDELNLKPVLIQNVIHKTNQYLAKYQVNNIANTNIINKDLIKNEHNIATNSRFLKKGDGMGGGRAVIEIDYHKSKDKLSKQQRNKQVLIKKKDKFQLLLQNCLLDSDCRQRKNNNDIQSNSNVQIKTNKRQNINLNKKQAIHQQYEKNPQQFYQSIYSEFYQQQQLQLKQYQPQQHKNKHKHNQQIFQREHNNIQQINNIQKYRKNNNQNFNKNKQTFQNSNISQDDVNQINQLIDLAYSYKFGKF